TTGEVLVTREPTEHEIAAPIRRRSTEPAGGRLVRRRRVAASPGIGKRLGALREQGPIGIVLAAQAKGETEELRCTLERQCLGRFAAGGNCVLGRERILSRTEVVLDEHLRVRVYARGESLGELPVPMTSGDGAQAVHQCVANAVVVHLEALAVA